MSLAITGSAEIDESRFASFRLSVLTSTGPLFWFVWAQHAQTRGLKDHDWNDFVKLLQWADFHGFRCSCYPSARIDSGLNRGQLRCRSAWLEDLWKADPRTCWPNDGKASTCMALMHSLLRGFQSFCAAKTSAQKFCARQKKHKKRVSS